MLPILVSELVPSYFLMQAVGTPVRI